MRVVLLIWLVALTQAQAQLPWVKVTGNTFTVDDKVIVFRGLDASDPYKLKRDGQWNKRYLQEMKNWGANIVRFPVHPMYWRGVGKENYMKMLDEGIQWATELQLYVIIDWHTIGNLRSELFQDPMYETTQKETFEFWQHMAKRYGKNSTVAFFELFNEPTLFHGKLGRCTWQEWRLLMEEIITIIRAHEANTVPLVAGLNWAYDLSEALADPIRAENVAYVSHPYPMKREKPWEHQWTKDWGAMKDKYPVILTEIGFCGADDKGAHVPVISDESYGEAITAYCKERGISYTVWVFDPNWSPMLISDWDFTPTRQGRYFKKALQQRN